MNADLQPQFVTELQIHSKLSHPNIVTFYRAFSFQTSTYVVLELCPNGSLADMLKKRKYLTLPEIRRFVIQICGAVKYLHHRHIVHRDLKTGNLFLDENMNVQVGDFGLAALLVTEREMEVKRRTTMCGTPNYLAPEILEKGKGHDEKVDLWAIGVIAYTLAVGKAPFHASTKEEIYKKLKSGTYTWPELSATTNQSADLRNLVAKLLVPEEQRLAPDQIVSENFFKIAFVPPRIPVSAKEKAPIWSEVSVPSADTIKRGYSETWYTICKQSGVGEYDEGKIFRLNGGKRVKSIVHDIAQEALLGRQPTMPIPKDTVYVSTVSSWDTTGSSDEESARHEERRQASRSRGLKEIPPNEVATTRPEVAARKAARDAELMPPPSRQPSRPGRTATVRKVARTISEETADSKGTVRISPDAPSQMLQVSKTRPATAVASASATIRELNNSSSSAGRSGRSQQVSESDSEKPRRAGTVKRSADASLARRPRGVSRSTRKDHAVCSEAPGPLATLDELKQVSPIKRSRKKQPETEVIEILSDLEADDLALAHPVISLPPPPTMPRRLPVPRKHTKNANGIPGTNPDTVLERLTIFRDNLSSALANRKPPSFAPETEIETLPFVSRWVDYSRKHGVGYVMSDGTVGCIINASAKNQTPITHVFVRNGQRWLARVGKNFEHIDRVPLEIMEDRGADGIAKNVYKGLGSVREGPLAAEDERRRTLSVLWVKFGRYMCQSLDGDEADQGRVDGNFVRFYQRIGNVGIWAFADGCLQVRWRFRTLPSLFMLIALQVHFPDHTKLVISSSGSVISATCISPEAAAYLATHSDLLPHHVSSREVYTDSISSLLHEGGRIRSRVVKANVLAQKLAFVLRVVEQWISNAGLGRLDADEGAEAMGEKLYWEGLTVKDGARKVDRVTVGRYGGDDVSGRLIS